MSIAVGLVGLGSWLGFRSLFVSESERAVLARHLIVLRSPISGQVESTELTEGALLQGGAEAFVIKDPRADTWHETELVQERERLLGEQAAMERALDSLSRMRKSYRNGEERSRAVQVKQLEAMLAGAQADEGSQRALAATADEQLRRSRALGDAGLKPQAELEQAQAMRESAAAAAEKAAHQRESLAMLVSAVSSGAPVDTSTGVGFSYARQRADDVSLLVLTTQREVQRLSASLAALDASITLEKSRASLLQRSPVQVGRRSRIWRRFASSAAFVTAGQPLADAIDCSEEFVSALVYARHAAKLRVGSIARVTLRDDQTDYRGELVNIGADSPNVVAPALDPPADTTGTTNELVRVLIRLVDAPARLHAACEAGVDARVRF
jgi:multidrug resistance efflux pump